MSVVSIENTLAIEFYKEQLENEIPNHNKCIHKILKSILFQNVIFGLISVSVKVIHEMDVYRVGIRETIVSYQMLL